MERKRNEAYSTVGSDDVIDIASPIVLKGVQIEQNCMKESQREEKTLYYLKDKYSTHELYCLAPSLISFGLRFPLEAMPFSVMIVYAELKVTYLIYSVYQFILFLQVSSKSHITK